jgi:ubiquinone/menaquinone biosynthesis C-methylase UbiE
MREDRYRNVGRFYDRLFEPMTSGLRLLGVRMSRPQKGMAVLDVGCGTGTHLELYRRYGCSLFGIDSSSMLEMARDRLGDGAELRLQDASEMPYENGAFDLVTCMLALHEMNQAMRAAVISEMKRVLKDTGRILLIDFHPVPLRPFKGWLTKPIIFLSELAAGGEHFRNYRHFMAIKGLPTLIQENSLQIEKERVVGGGALALFLLSNPSSE